MVQKCNSGKVMKSIRKPCHCLASSLALSATSNCSSPSFATMNCKRILFPFPLSHFSAKSSFVRWHEVIALSTEAARTSKCSLSLKRFTALSSLGCTFGDKTCSLNCSLILAFCFSISSESPAERNISQRPLIIEKQCFFINSLAIFSTPITSPSPSKQRSILERVG